jgi:hypothetical protein
MIRRFGAFQAKVIEKEVSCDFTIQVERNGLYNEDKEQWQTVDVWLVDFRRLWNETEPDIEDQTRTSP